MTPQAILAHTDAIRLSENRIYVQDWKSSGGRVSVQPSGHCVFYGRHGQRILLADPEGNPLHECLWTQKSAGDFSLVSARLRLDWGQWVGIKPKGLINTISLDLSRRTGWDRLTRDDLRHMAARSMQSDLEMMRFFYRDEDLVFHGDGRATIHQVKDAFYVLPHGSFENAKFMSCMSRMEWNRIDYLPVVELFLSLLPGTGSATFELIRGLYDDQNTNGARPLQYRGIPVYPSEAAFRLFSLFFTPSAPSNQSALEVFLEPKRSHEVHWFPSSDYPVRYIDEEQGLCATVRNHTIQKATLWDDSAGLSFNRIQDSGRPISDNRGVVSYADQLWFLDGAVRKRLTVRSSWQLSGLSHSFSWQPFGSTWRDCFPLKPPVLAPSQAFSSVLQYPENHSMIGEPESQPFVFDFLEDFFEERQDLFHWRSTDKRVLISHCDAGLGSCINFQQPRIYTIWYTWPDYAQKHAQSIWNRLSRMDRLPWLPNFHLIPFELPMLDALQERYDWIYLWIPFSDYANPTMIGRWGNFLRTHLSKGGIGCVAGPPVFKKNIESPAFKIVHAMDGDSLPTFRIHQTILPNGWLNPDLHIWVVQGL